MAWNQNSDNTFLKQWQLIQLLSETAEGLTVKELADGLQCSRRTIQRHLALFRQCGIPLTDNDFNDDCREKTWRICFSAKNLQFTFDEVAAIYMSRRFLEPMKGTVCWQAMSRALMKMKASLENVTFKLFEQSMGVMEQNPSGVGNYCDMAEWIDLLNLAVTEHRHVRILYRSLEDTQSHVAPSVTDLDPYGLAWHDGGLYLVGWSHKRRAIRHWKIDRMFNVEVLGETFVPPANFSFSDYVAQLFGMCGIDPHAPVYHVRIRFRSFAAKQVCEKHWHPSEVFVKESDITEEAVILEMDIGNLGALKRWILGFGKHAEVLAPKELIEMIQREIEQTTALYQKA